MKPRAWEFSVIVRVVVALFGLALMPLQASVLEGDSFVPIFTETPFPGFPELPLSPALSAGIPFLNWSAGEVALPEESVATITRLWVNTDDTVDPSAERTTLLRNVLITTTAILGIALAGVLVGFLTTRSPLRSRRDPQPRTSSSILIR